MNQHKVAFQEINILTEHWPAGINAVQYYHVILEAMNSADCLLIVADRYTKYQLLVEQELHAAQFLMIPIIVLQPWSCWHLPHDLKVRTNRICMWKGPDLANTIYQMQKKGQVGR